MGVEAEELTKKVLAEYILETCSDELKEKHKLSKGAIKKNPKEFWVAAYKDMVGAPAQEPAAAENCTEAAAPAEEAVQEKKKIKEKLYKKKIIKKGKGKESMPKKGNTVRCHYIGKLEDGYVFDQSNRGKKGQPLSFKVGTGQVIKGWDEALLTMSVGEVAQITIEPEWGYGKKGCPEAKIP